LIHHQIQNPRLNPLERETTIKSQASNDNKPWKNIIKHDYWVKRNLRKIRERKEKGAWKKEGEKGEKTFLQLRERKK
jgi:hypothetical protein